VAVFAGMMLTGFLGVMLGLNVVAMRDVGMVTGFLVVTSFVMLGSHAMMFGGVIMVLRGFMMMLRCFFGHVY
jgi:hypothetical protein